MNSKILFVILLTEANLQLIQRYGLPKPTISCSSDKRQCQLKILVNVSFYQLLFSFVQSQATGNVGFLRMTYMYRPASFALIGMELYIDFYGFCVVNIFDLLFFFSLTTLLHSQCTAVLPPVTRWWAWCHSVWIMACSYVYCWFVVIPCNFIIWLHDFVKDTARGSVQNWSNW